MLRVTVLLSCCVLLGAGCAHKKSPPASSQRTTTTSHRSTTVSGGHVQDKEYVAGRDDRKVDSRRDARVRPEDDRSLRAAAPVPAAPRAGGGETLRSLKKKVWALPEDELRYVLTPPEGKSMPESKMMPPVPPPAEPTPPK